MTEFQQGDDLWKAVKNEKDRQARQLKMLEFARILLKSAKMDDSSLKELSGSDRLTDYFIEYLETADLISDFFRKAFPHLEPELLGGEFEKQIRETGEHLAEILEQSENLHRKNAKLLEKKNFLMEESRKLSELESELDSLRLIDEQAKPENMNALSQELELLKQRIQEKQPEMKILNNAIQAAGQMLESLKDSRDTSVEDMLNLSEELSKSLDHKWEEYDTRLSHETEKLKQKNTMHREITGRLENCMKNFQELASIEENKRELYRRHFSANAEISKSAGHVSKLSEEISEKLDEFDLDLKRFIQAHEDAVRQIRQMNETG